MLTTHLATQRLTELLDRAAADLDATRRLLAAAVGRMDDASPGYPAGGHGNGSGDDSGPTRGQVVLGDAALKDRHALTARLAAIEMESRAVLRIAQKWGIRSVGESTREPDEMWCRSCLRAGHMAPRREGHGATCRWCGDALRVINAMRNERRQPPLSELPIEAIRWHAEGRKVTDKLVEQWSRNAKARRA